MSSERSKSNDEPNTGSSSTGAIKKKKSGRKSSESENVEGEKAPETTSSNTIESAIDALREFFAKKASLRDDEEDEEDNVKILDEVSLDGIVQYITKNKCKNIITMAGAGISTTAGIPDFRSPGTGLYHNLQKFKLPHPQAIFELDFFIKNPKPFFALAKELYPGKFKPTICHYFIRMLNEKGLLLRHYTQNIDTLERIAGVPEDKLVEAHGTFHTGHCLDCHAVYSLEWMRDQIFNDQVPTCEKCKGIVKPDIVFFGESLPNRFHKLLDKDFEKCDLLIILGSSLAVHPFASLVDMPHKTCPRLLINREKAGVKSGFMALMGMSGGLNFDSSKNSRDVAWLGDCDDGCRLLAEKLGWGDELRKLVESEHEKIESQS